MARRPAQGWCKRVARLLGVVLLGGLETIAHAVDGVEPLGVARVIAQLGAQVLDVRVDGALVALEIVAEDLLHELHAGVDAAGVTGKRGEELELGSGELNLVLVDRNLVAGDVDDELAEVEDLELGLGILAGSRGEKGLTR